MFAAAGYKLVKNYTVFTSDNFSMLLFGNVVSFIVAWIAIKSFIAFLTKHGFKVFGYYRIIIGLLIIILGGTMNILLRTSGKTLPFVVLSTPIIVTGLLFVLSHFYEKTLLKK